MLLTLLLVAVITVFLFWAFFWSKRDHDYIMDRIPGPPLTPILGNGISFIGAKPEDFFKSCRDNTKIYGDRWIIKVLNRYIVQCSNPKDVEVILSHSRNISKNLPYKLAAPWLGNGLLLSTETAMGTRLDSDNSSDALTYKDAIMKIGPLLLQRLTTLWFRSEFIFKMSAVGKEMTAALETLHSFADNVILQRKNNRPSNTSDMTKDTEDMTKNRLAMMDLLLEAEGRGEIDLAGIREEVNTFIFEGHDTTAMALTFALILLADHPDVQDKILSETRTVLGSTEGVPSLSQFSEMKYLEAVIKETLRLYPSVPFIAREVSEDFMLDHNIKIKKGMEIGIHIFDLHRRGDTFPDPEEFRPERFLHGSPTQPYAYVPFSAGPRNCIGQKFAMLEMKCVLSEVCRKCRITRSNRDTIALKHDLALRPVHPVYLQFHAR